MRLHYNNSVQKANRRSRRSEYRAFVELAGFETCGRDDCRLLLLYDGRNVRRYGIPYLDMAVEPRTRNPVLLGRRSARRLERHGQSGLTPSRQSEGQGRTLRAPPRPQRHSFGANTRIARGHPPRSQRKALVRARHKLQRFAKRRLFRFRRKQFRIHRNRHRTLRPRRGTGASGKKIRTSHTGHPAIFLAGGGSSSRRVHGLGARCLALRVSEALDPQGSGREMLGKKHRKPLSGRALDGRTFPLGLPRVAFQNLFDRRIDPPVPCR